MVVLHYGCHCFPQMLPAKGTKEETVFSCADSHKHFILD